MVHFLGGSFQAGREELRLRRVHCSLAEGKDGVYRIWGTGGEGDLDTKHRCETDESLEIASFELLPAGIRNALNALVPAEGRAEEIGRLPLPACAGMTMLRSQ
jgi:hypothetical protein